MIATRCISWIKLIDSVIREYKNNNYNLTVRIFREFFKIAILRAAQSNFFDFAPKISRISNFFQKLRKLLD